MTRTVKTGFASGILAFAVVAAPGASYSQTGTHQTTPPSPQSTAPAPGTQERKASTEQQGSLSKADCKFLLEAAQGGAMEVELGTLATQKAGNEEVKRFGQRMVDDHTKANQQLMELAKRKNVDVPAAHGAAHDKMGKQLSALSGEAFDRAYMRHMVTDHQKDVKAFHQEATAGGDSDVKTFAQRTLTVLQEHLKEAERIASIVGASAVGTTGKSGKQGQ